MSNHMKISAVRKWFFKNPNDTLEQIAERFNLAKSTISEYLTNKDDLNVVKSLNEANLYFLFNSLTERKICTENDGVTIINTSDFSFEDKRYLKSFGLNCD